MKLLIIHNILWAHYKSVLFEAMNNNKPNHLEMMVLHLAKNELSRKNMETENVAYSYPFKVLFNDYIENLSALKKIYAVFKYILKYNPDIINVTGYAVDISITLSVFLGKLLGKKVIISTESTAIDNQKNKFKEWFKKLVIKCADGYICFGTNAANYLLELGADPQKIIENKAAVVDDQQISSLYHAAVANPIKHYPTKHNFIFVGRLIALKNVKSLIEEFGFLKKNFAELSDWGLIILGDGEEKEILEKNTQAQKIENIYFEEAVGWREVPSYFALANVLVLPSFSEPWGLVVNEAMICGLPIIISKQCGCAKDLLNENGLLIDANDSLQLREALLALAKDHTARKSMGEKSKEIIKDFTVDEVGKRIMNNIKNI